MIQTFFVPNMNQIDNKTQVMKIRFRVEDLELKLKQNEKKVGERGLTYTRSCGLKATTTDIMTQSKI